MIKHKTPSYSKLNKHQATNFSHNIYKLPGISMFRGWSLFIVGRGYKYEGGYKILPPSDFVGGADL